MDYTHIHLLLNHFPIIGTLIGTLLLLTGIWKKNQLLTGSSLFTIAAMALIAIPVFLTGEPAEESVENIPGVLEAVIEEHEEAAEIAFWVMEITGVIALVGFIFSVLRPAIPMLLLYLSLISGLVTFVLMGRTAYLGGKIRHTEIGSSTNTTEQSAVETEEESSEEE